MPYLKFLPVLLIMFLTACLSNHSIILSSADDQSIEGLKIGLVADSQLQTTSDTKFDAMIKGELEDKLVNVALRLPALNKYSDIMLRFFLEQLIEVKKVNVIFYLGDGANNGCKDEINRIFKILGEYKKGTRALFSGKNLPPTPVYFIIGNHDYLGAGNTPFKNSRIKLCTCNDDDSSSIFIKKDLILKASEFNKSNKMTGWEYSDNVMNNMDEFIRLCDRDNKGGFCAALRGEKITEVRKPGCFLSGYLFNKQNNYKILLMDTSDYYGKWYIDTEKFFKKKWYGMTGWISDNQIDFFKSRLAKDTPLTIIVTHYPYEDLAVSNKYQNSGLIKQIAEEFMSVNPAIGNYWLSAHTHKFYSYEQVKTGTSSGKITFDHINTGSTTDSYIKTGWFSNKKNIQESEIKPPHALAVSFSAGNRPGISRLIADPVYINNDEVYKSVIAFLKDVVKNTDGSYDSIKDINREVHSGLTIFGLHKKKKFWGNYKAYNKYVRICNKNLDKLVKYLYDNRTSMKPEGQRKLTINEIKLYIGRFASYMELKQ